MFKIKANSQAPIQFSSNQFLRYLDTDIVIQRIVGITKIFQ